jgi:hypothetical protein
MDYYDSGAASLIIGIAFIFLLLFLIPFILYLVMLQRTMQMVSPDLRKMTPGQVWLIFIPVFGIVWNFLMVGYIADSVSAELQRRNLPQTEERAGYGPGLTMCILNVCGIIPFIGSFIALVGLVFWIVYWVKMSGYKRQLEQSNFFQPPFQQPFQQQNFGQNPGGPQDYNRY